MKKITSILFILIIVFIGFFLLKEKSWERPFEVNNSVYPFESKIYTWSGYNIHYIDESQEKNPKATVLMIHGNWIWSMIYRKMATQLKSEWYRVIAIDLLWFGMSDRPSEKEFDYMPSSQSKIIKDFFQYEDLDDVYLVLQDRWWPIGIDLAQTFPNKTSGILFMNTRYRNLETPWNYNYYHAVHNRGLMAQQQPEFFLSWTFLLPGDWLSKRNAEEWTPLYEYLKHAYLAPYFNTDTYELLNNEALVPFHISAKATVEDSEFLEKLDSNIKKINDIPIYFMFGDDTAFGPLKVDTMQFQNKEYCPEWFNPSSEDITQKIDCLDENGELYRPYAEKVLSDREKDSIVWIRKKPEYWHWLQDEVPEIAVEHLGELYNHNN